MEIKDVLKIGHGASVNTLNEPDNAETISKSDVNLISRTERTPLVNKTSLGKQQFWALSKVRYIRSIRDKPLLVINLLFPVIFVIIGLVISKVTKPSPKTAPPALNLSYGLGAYTNYSLAPVTAHNPPFLIRNTASMYDVIQLN